MFVHQSRAKLQGAKLQEAKLKGANLQGANLTRAKLRGAKLQGADLRGAILLVQSFSKISLYGAKVNEHTRWECSLEKRFHDQEKRSREQK